LGRRQGIVNGTDPGLTLRFVLRLWLCGRLAGSFDGEPVAMPTSERARALIGWLALHPGLHPRRVVAAEL
jgi:hypothetical protein